MSNQDLRRQGTNESMFKSQSCNNNKKSQHVSTIELLYLESEVVSINGETNK